jgi:hypothetical protein
MKNELTANAGDCWVRGDAQVYGVVKAGDLGYWIHSEANLSQDVDCWVRGDAQVYGDVQVPNHIVVCE